MGRGHTSTRGLLIKIARVGQAGTIEERASALRATGYELRSVFRALPVPERRAVAQAGNARWLGWSRTKRSAPSTDLKRLNELLTAKDPDRVAWLITKLCRPLVPADPRAGAAEAPGAHPPQPSPGSGAPEAEEWAAVAEQLAPHLETEQRRCLRYAAETAGRCGTAAARHLPVLVWLVENKPSPIRQSAVRAIGRILAGPRADSTPGRAEDPAGAVSPPGWRGRR